MFLNSIRWRLLIWYGILLAVTLAGFAFTSYQVEKNRRWRALDDQLHRRVNVVMACLKPGLPEDMPPPGQDRIEDPPPRRRDFDPRHPQLRLSIRDAALFDDTDRAGFYYAVWGWDGELLDQSPHAPAHLQRPTAKAGTSGQLNRGEFRQFYVVTPPGECVLVGASTAAESAELGRLSLSLLGVGGVVLLLGLAGGWWLATRAIAPIHRISATAEKIASGDLSQRISPLDKHSELARLTDVLNASFGRLEAAFLQQGRFTADAAHELRTPLSVILLQVQMALKRERSPEDYRATLESCQRAAQRMKTLVDSLMELARLDAGQEPMQLSEWDLPAPLGECLEMLMPLAAEKQVTLHRDLAPVRVRGDARHLARVFTNLISNAISYNHPGGTVWVSCRLQQGHAVISVKDTGVGISAEDIPKLFERFYRVDKARSSSEGHAGLGLAMCRAILTAHGGQIEVDSTPGAGSTFTLTLPAAD